jgi:hypothetical protein
MVFDGVLFKFIEVIQGAMNAFADLDDVEQAAEILERRAH